MQPFSTSAREKRNASKLNLKREQLSQKRLTKKGEHGVPKACYLITNRVCPVI